MFGDFEYQCKVAADLTRYDVINSFLYARLHHNINTLTQLGELYYTKLMALVQNKKAYFDYEILEQFEAGIELFGFEVKSVLKQNAHLEGGRVLLRGDEAFLVGVTISPYQVNNTPQGYEPDRTRKLLLHKKEIAYLSGKQHERGLTLVPISMYTKGPKIKLAFGVARHKKKYDKRDVIKKREDARKISRTLKRE